MYGQERLLRWIVGVAIVGGPLAYLLGGVLAPPSMHVSGAETVRANAVASGVTNNAHLVAFFAASFLLPIGVFGLAWLAYRSSPWLATIGGLLGVLGWIPFSALTALDALAAEMARTSSDPLLYDHFAYGTVMNTYLIVYIAGHLLAYVLLGIALRRANVLPTWAAWAMVASSPLTMAMFVLPGNPVIVGAIAVGLLVAGSLPAALFAVRKKQRQKRVSL